MEWLKHLTIRHDGEYVFVNGRAEGVCYKMYPGTKQLEYEIHYLNGRRHGIRLAWWENGRLAHYDVYNHGRPTNIHYAWDEDGVALYYGSDICNSDYD